MMLNTDITTTLFFGAQLIFVLSAFMFAISAIDDFLIDLYFYLFLGAKKKGYGPQMVNTKALCSPAQRHLAIMLPAWQESGVLEKSVSNIIRTLDYENYHIFIGTYPNDQPTQTEAKRLARQFDRVHQVVTPLPGPTCKADCLNSIVNAIFDFEKKASIVFGGFILQDAEDIVHKLGLKAFNYYLDNFDLIQIPVFSLQRKWHQLTASHYMDEFAEFQSKEIRVREKLAGLVPGAGVGTAYSRKAVLTFYSKDEVFRTNTLTEDYEFSIRLHEIGFKQISACLMLEDDHAPETTRSKKTARRNKIDKIISTREYFPNRFWAAVRQKTRWTIGISLQGWKNFHWRGNWRIRYLLWRDRKMLFFAQAIAAGFVALLLFSALKAYHVFFLNGYKFAPLLAPDSLVWNLVYFNFSMTVIRILQRYYWTYTLYGWSALPMLPVRYVWGALINYLAITRAIKIFFYHEFKGQTIGWDKTAHDFPEQFFSPVESAFSGTDIEAEQNTATQGPPIHPPLPKENLQLTAHLN
jgi:adsorption protein B